MPATSKSIGISVLVVDDHEVVQWGLRLLLTRQSWVERCLNAATVGEALSLARSYAPRVAVVDLFLGVDSGLDLCVRLREESSRTRVLLISGSGAVSARAARQVGAWGFVRKDSAVVDVLRAVHDVAHGKRVFTPSSGRPPPRLSRREHHVLELMASGATNREIAAKLGLSPHTIKQYTSTLYRKLDTRNRLEAVQAGQRGGLIE